MKPQIAIYLRLSLEDVDLRSNRSKDESNSVGNQRLLIRNHIARKSDLSKLPILEFCDDGYTGTNFDRPQFQSMLELAKDGQISCIIVKDLSRFGRSYLEVGDYLEHIFPFLGVRFIAVNDNFDSSDYIGITSGIDIAFRNLIHQKYSEDLSDKVKSAMRMKMAKGEYVNHAPFGYMKSPYDKHRIVPNPETAPIVRKIFDAILAGRSTTEVAVMLNAEQTLTPMGYKKWRERAGLTGRMQLWNHRTILRIIKDLKYTGDMVNHKCENRYIRDKTQRRVPQSEWMITEGMHEGIVTRDEFRAAGYAIRNMQQGERTKSDAFDRVFYCGHCGRKLRKSCNVNDYFACETSVYQPDAGCGSYRWNTLELENVLLGAYKGQLLIMRSKLKTARTRKGSENAVDFVAKIKQVEKELVALDAKKLQEYEVYRAGQLSKESFLEQKVQILETTERLKAEKLDAEEQLAIRQQAKAEKEHMVETLTTITNTASVSDEILRMQMYEDIDRVLVFSNESIEISWKFEDCFITEIKRDATALLGVV